MESWQSEINIKNEKQETHYNNNCKGMLITLKVLSRQQTWVAIKAEKNTVQKDQKQTAQQQLKQGKQQQTNVSKDRH